MEFVDEGCEVSDVAHVPGHMVLGPGIELCVVPHAWGLQTLNFAPQLPPVTVNVFLNFKILPLSSVFLLLYLWCDSGEHIPPKLVNEVAEGEEGNPLKSHIEQNIDICFLNSKVTQLSLKHLSS